MQRTSVALIALSVGLAALAMLPLGRPEPAAVQACPGPTFPVRFAPGGSAPYIDLSAAGRRGNMLLDWGATTSSLSRSAFADLPASGRIENFSLPGFSGGNLALSEYPEAAAPPGGQIGLIGTDFLSLMGAQLVYGRDASSVTLGAEPCDAGKLAAGGFVPVRQAGAFTAEPSRTFTRPRVPVVFIGIGRVHAPAQIDTGYDDVVWRHSIDINEALYRRLLADGAQLVAQGEVKVATCSGWETRTVYRLDLPQVVIETETRAAVARIDGVHLIPKPPSSCGGIANFDEPSAQLGASILRTLGGIVIDGKSERVWVRANRS